MPNLMFTSSLLYGSWQWKKLLLPLSFIEYYLKETPGYINIQGKYYWSSNSIAVQTLKPGHLKKDCPISTFSENKRIPSCFANGPQH